MTDNHHFERFERLGEERVKLSLADRHITPAGIQLAKVWLSEKERDRNDAARKEDRAIALSTKNAAWIAAVAAIIAAVCAIISMFY